LIPLEHNTARAQPEAPACSTTEFGNPTFGAPVEVDVVLSAARPDAARLLSSDDTERSAIRFLVAVEDVEDANWTLEFRDKGFRLLDRIEARDIANGASIWTGRFNAQQASAHLIGASDTDKIRIDKAITYHSDGSDELFSVLDGTPKWQSLHGDNEQPALGNLSVARTWDSV
jgi:hypothetical protein